MIRIGIICPSEIAFRRFLPALKKVENQFHFVGVAIANPEEWFGDISNIPQKTINEQQKREYEKAESFGGKVFNGYETIIKSNEIDAIYIPLPPALHYKWAKLALENNKHVFVEKPSTTCLHDTNDLIQIASQKGLALHENYMFVYHSQIDEINNVVKSGKIGDVRLYRISFGFPRRPANDFRYNKSLGGGALLDAGGYCLKYANLLLGGTSHVICAQSNYVDGFDVDMYGSATLMNDKFQVAQIAFGMDNDYHCDIEIWGSSGTISSGRILTAPVGYQPSYSIKVNQDTDICYLSTDDAFLKSIQYFDKCINDENTRQNNYLLLRKQEQLVEEFTIKAMNSLC